MFIYILLSDFLLCAVLEKHKGQGKNSQDLDPPLMTASAEIDVQLSDSEGDGPSTSRKTPASTSQQKAPNISSDPSQESEENSKEDGYGLSFSFNIIT